MLVSPRSVFESLRAHPRVLGVLVVLAALFIVASFLQTDLMMQEQLDRLDERPDMTEEGRVKAEQSIRIFTRFVTPFVIPVGVIVAVLAVSGVLLFIGNVVLGGDARFKQYFAGVAHVQMVAIPMMLVRVPLTRATGDLQVPTSLAGLLSPDQRGTMLYNALAQLDVFGLWQLALTVILVSVLVKVPTRKAAYGVLGAWVVWTVIWVPLQTFFAGLGGM